VQSNAEPKYLETWVMKHIVFNMITTQVWNMTLQLDVVHNVSMIYFHNLHLIFLQYALCIFQILFICLCLFSLQIILKTYHGVVIDVKGTSGNLCLQGTARQLELKIQFLFCSEKHPC
jgi:hypothetical protein